MSGTSDSITRVTTAKMGADTAKMGAGLRPKWGQDYGQNGGRITAKMGAMVKD